VLDDADEGSVGGMEGVKQSLQVELEATDQQGARTSTVLHSATAVKHTSTN